MVRIILFFLGILFFLPGFGQELVKDISEGKAGFLNSGQQCFTCGDLVYFNATDEKGSELWKTDGTAEGTVRVADINPGLASGIIQFNPKCRNGILYFAGSDFSGRTLWKTDGSLSGTIKVSSQLVTSDIHLYKGSVIFLNGNQLWISDGTNNGTSMIFEQQGMISQKLFAGMTYIYFSLLNTSNKEELWRSDGTTLGTFFVKEIDINISGAYGFEAGNKFLFNRVFQSHGTELWATDGTPQGTLLVKDFLIGSTNQFLFLKSVFNGKVIVDFQFNTWLSDGTTGGTTVVFPSFVSYLTRELNSKLYAVGFDYTRNRIALFSSDGSPGDALEIGEIGLATIDLNSSRQIPIVNNKLILPYYNSSIGTELGFSDVLQNSITFLKDINPGSAESKARSFAELGNLVIFLADDGEHGVELWASDGAESGTYLLKDTQAGTSSTSFFGLTPLNNKLFFAARENTSIRDVWSSDATESGTKKEIDFMNGSGVVVGTSGDYVYAAGLSSTKVFKIHSGSGEVSEVANDYFLNGFVNTPILIGKNCFNYLSSSYGTEIWKMNAFENSFHILKDINPGNGSSTPNYDGIAPQALNNKLVFPADDGIHGAEIWISDGTEAGTNMLKDLSSGSSSPSFLSQANDRIYFRADDGIHGEELWVTDGSAGGTSLVKDIVQGSTGALATTTFNSIMAGIGSSVIFSANDGNGMEVWFSDGTEEGTKLLKDIKLVSGSNPSLFTTINNKVYFTADDGIHGIELWVTDGTSTGTVMIEITEGALGSSPNLFSQVGDWTYFTADFKLWRTQGNQASTFLVADIQPNRKVNVVGDWILFTAHTPEYGEELYKLPIIKVNQTIVFQPIPIKNLSDSPFNLVGGASSGLEVEYSSTSGKVSIAGNTVSLIQPGKATINANQSGNSFFEPANKVSQSFCINPLKPTVAVNSADPSQPVLTSSSLLGNMWYKNEVLLNENAVSLNVTESGNYKLKVKIDDCESEFSESKSFIITGLDNKDSEFRIYPNPANQKLQISTNSNSGIVQILSSTGIAVYESHLSESDLTLDVSGYPTGVYLLKITVQGSTSIQKWIKN